MTNNQIISKVPPHNIEAEQAVLGAILLNNEMFSKVSKILQHQDFYLEAHQIIFSTMSLLYQSNSPIDLVTLTDALTKQNLIKKIQGEAVYIASLPDAIAAPSNAIYYSKIIQQLSIQRQILSLSSSMMSSIANDSTDFNTLHKILKKTVDEINELQDTLKGDDILDYKLDIREIFTDEKMEDIEEIIPGISKGTVVSLVAPGGTGKSFFSLELCIGLATGGEINFLGLPLFQKKFKVSYVTLEDLTKIVRVRLKALRAKINPQHWPDIFQNFEIYPLSGKNAVILSLQKERNYTWINRYYKIAEISDLMIIDTLRRAHRGKENDDADMTEVLSILEEIAMETNCAIMFCHHTNKDSLKNQSGNQQYASRGSSVLVDNVRGQFNLFEITNKKAKELGIQEEEKWRYIQLSSSKLNNAEKYSDIIFERQKGSGVLMAINKDFNIVNDIYTATHQSVNIEDVPDEELAKIMCS